MMLATCATFLHLQGRETKYQKQFDKLSAIARKCAENTLAYHLENKFNKSGMDIDYPQFESFQLKLVLKGLARLNPHCSKQARPITPTAID
jgi:hypothetical protein